MAISEGPSKPPEDASPTTIQATEWAQEAQAVATALAVVTQRFMTALQPIAVAIGTFLERPEVQAGLARAGARMLDMHDRIAAVDAPGYTPYFERLGHSPLSAKLHAGIVRHFARRHFEESRDKRIALSALHDLARRRRWHPALARQVARLRDHCWDAGFLDDAFRRAGCPTLKAEFLELLQATQGRNVPQGPRLLAIIRLIAPYAPSARGRPLSYESALHRTFLRWSAHAGGRQGYTYGMVKDDVEAVGDFIDEATAATRIELSDPSFCPVAARRAARVLLAKDAEAERRISAESKTGTAAGQT